MHQYDDGFRALLDAGDAILELEDVVAEGGGAASCVEVCTGGTHGWTLGGGLDVQTGGVGARAFSGKKDTANVGIAGELLEDLGEIEPHSGWFGWLDCCDDGVGRLYAIGVIETLAFEIEPSLSVEHLQQYL